MDRCAVSLDWISPLACVLTDLRKEGSVSFAIEEHEQAWLAEDILRDAGITTIAPPYRDGIYLVYTVAWADRSRAERVLQRAGIIE